MIGQNSFIDLNNKFIIGKSGIPDDAGLSKLLNFDVLTPQYMPIYDCDQNQTIVYATKDGAAHINVQLGRYVAGNNSIHEPEGFSDSVFDKAVEHMLTEILMNMNVPIALYKEEGMANIQRWDLMVSTILTKDKLSAIPDGMGLAITDPEFLGTIYVRGDQDAIATEWGAFIFNIDRAMVLFNINADITQVETVVLNFVENCIKNKLDHDQYYGILDEIKLLLLKAGIPPLPRTEELIRERIVKQIHNL